MKINENDGAKFKRGLNIGPRGKAQEHTLYGFARVRKIHDHRKKGLPG
jgi:hypothetical protein